MNRGVLEAYIFIQQNPKQNDKSKEYPDVLLAMSNVNGGLKKAFNFKQVSYSHGNFNQEKFATNKMQMISQCF